MLYVLKTIFIRYYILSLQTPTADGLVVRVISSVDKKLEIKPRFLELFQQEYPKEMQYKSKVCLLLHLPIEAMLTLYTCNCMAVKLLVLVFV